MFLNVLLYRHSIIQNLTQWIFNNDTPAPTLMLFIMIVPYVIGLLLEPFSAFHYRLIRYLFTTFALHRIQKSNETAEDPHDFRIYPFISQFRLINILKNEVKNFVPHKNMISIEFCESYLQQKGIGTRFLRKRSMVLIYRNIALIIFANTFFIFCTGLLIWEKILIGFILVLLSVGFELRCISFWLQYYSETYTLFFITQSQTGAIKQVLDKTD